MTQEDDQGWQSYEPLDDLCVVYRSALYPNHCEKTTGQLVKKAFLRRGPHPETGDLRDQLGISVNLNCDLQTIRNQFLVIHAIGETRVGRIRQISTSELDVIQDGPTHANITGLPASGEDTERAERLASQLAGICVCVYKR